jgi:hypothetical protein
LQHKRPEELARHDIAPRLYRIPVTIRHQPSANHLELQSSEGEIIAAAKRGDRHDQVDLRSARAHGNATAEDILTVFCVKVDFQSDASPQSMQTAYIAAQHLIWSHNGQTSSKNRLTWLFAGIKVLKWDQENHRRSHTCAMLQEQKTSATYEHLSPGESRTFDSNGNRRRFFGVYDEDVVIDETLRIHGLLKIVLHTFDISNEIETAHTDKDIWCIWKVLVNIKEEAVAVRMGFGKNIDKESNTLTSHDAETSSRQKNLVQCLWIATRTVDEARSWITDPEASESVSAGRQKAIDFMNVRTL